MCDTLCEAFSCDIILITKKGEQSPHVPTQDGVHRCRNGGENQGDAPAAVQIIVQEGHSHTNHCHGADAATLLRWREMLNFLTKFQSVP